MAPPKTRKEALTFFTSLAPSGVRMGLDRIQTALKALRNPERNYPTLHVAGTNGKGSTCAFAASCLVAEGYRTGLYTSPHLLRVNERFKLDGEDIEDELLAQRILEVLDLYPQAAEEPYPLTFFEFGTLVAFWHFSKEQVDVAVIEVGLGGRLDATTACRASVTAITPISFDHMDYLGHTLQAIAGEKAAIMKPSVPCVVSPQPPEVMEVLEKHARATGAKLFRDGPDFRFEREAGPGESFVYRGMRTSVPRLILGLKGRHQINNAAVALASLELLEDQGIQISQESARIGLATAQWPGRFEMLQTRPPLIVDGAHNPAGAEVLAQTLSDQHPNKKVHLVFGVLADKDYGPMFKTLFPLAATLHLAPVNSARTLHPEKYLALAGELCGDISVYESVEAAVDGAKGRADAADVVLCTGSLFLVGQVKAHLARGGVGQGAKSG